MFVVTPSLYSQWHWYRAGLVPEEEFIKVLSKQPTTPSEAADLGLKYEKLVQQLWEEKEFNTPKNEQLAYEIQKEPTVELCLQKIEESMSPSDFWSWQLPLKRQLDDFKLVGRADIVSASAIVDIKRISGKRKYQPFRYQDSLQHFLYCYCSGIEDFYYVISDGKEVYTEHYVQDTSLCEQELRTKISEMFNDIYYQNDKFRELYNLYWSN